MTVDLTHICWDQPQPKLRRRQELSISADGLPTKADLGPALWTLDLTSRALPRQDADALYVKLLRAENDKVFIRASEFLWVEGYQGTMPNVEVASLADGRMTLSGLPGGVVLPEGVFFHVNVGNRREFFQSDGPSDEPGGFRFVPDARDVAVGNPVGLTPSVLDVQILPGTVDIHRTGTARKVVTCQVIQDPS